MEDRNMLQVPQQQPVILPRRLEGDEDEDEEVGAMGYQQTLMYGRYSRSLGDELQEEMKRQKMLHKTHKKEFLRIKTELR